MIVTDKKQLNIKCEPCSSIEEGEEIAVKLLKELTESKNGIGIAAPQIGIQKRVCIVNVPTVNNKEPIILINPEIVEKSEEKFAFTEGCLSFPNQTVKTMRHKNIKIKADNVGGYLYFTADSVREDDVSYAYETACVQHEIDHLDGITMFEREYKHQPIVRRFEKIGRNQKVLITKGSESKTIKYKKFKSYSEDGWVLSKV